MPSTHIPPECERDRVKKAAKRLKSQMKITILAHVILTVVDVLGAVGSLVSWCTFARVMGEVVDAFGAILAWIEVRAEWNLGLAVLARESGRTLACVRLDTIDASAVVFTFVFAAIVNVHLAS